MVATYRTRSRRVPISNKYAKYLSRSKRSGAFRCFSRMLETRKTESIICVLNVGEARGDLNRIFWTIKPCRSCCVAEYGPASAKDRGSPKNTLATRCRLTDHDSGIGCWPTDCRPKTFE
jgi:hypothetical protein